MNPISISLIPDHFVNEDKSLIYCNILPWTVGSLSELSTLITLFHFAIGTFKGDYRSTETFLQTQLLAYDFDNGDTVESVIDKVKHERHLIATSKNHMVDKHDGSGCIPRFHLFLLQDRPIVSGEQYKRLISQTKARLKLENTDPACCDCSRYFFKHKEILSIKENLTRDEQIARSMLPDTPPKIIKPPRLKALSPNDNDNPLSKFKRTKYFALMENGGLREDGSRQRNCCKCVGAMRLCGVERANAELLIHEYSEWGKSYTTKAVSRILDKFLV